MFPTSRVLAAVLAGVVVASACDKSPTSPTTPTPPTPPTPHATLVVSSTNVAGERRAEGGYTYRAVLHRTETAGITANIAAVNLTFLNGTTTLLVARVESVAPSTGKTCPARASVDTRELVATETTATNAFATAVRVEVTYGDATATGMTTTATGTVPPLGPAPPPTYTLTGLISDPGRAGIPNARVEVLNGDNAGKATTTDGGGIYTLTGLLGGTFRLRASADGFLTGEQNVTVPDIPRADFTLQRVSTTCTYTVSRTGNFFVSWQQGQFDVTITRTQGSCAWQATTDVAWLTPGNSTGNGTATLTFTYTGNLNIVGRSGTITFSWDGGSAQLHVNQDFPPLCEGAALTFNGPGTVPASGGSYTATLTWAPPPPPMPAALCQWGASFEGPITISPIGGGGTPPATINVTVAANPSPTPRAASIKVTFLNLPFPSEATLSINQAAGP